MYRSRGLDQASILYRDGKLEDAAVHCGEILDVEPRHFDALYLLGLVRSRQGRHTEALECLQAALKVQPSNAEVLANLGQVLSKVGRGEDALASYDKALAHRGDHPDTHNHRGSALMGLGRFDEALKSFDRALSLRPEFTEALNNRGVALYELKRPAEALVSYDKALAIRPDYALAHYNRGNALLLLRRPTEALASFDQALEVQPDQAGALNNRGNALRELGRFEEALASYDQALAIEPSDPEVLNNRGNALRELGRLEEALASYDQALAVRPEFIEVCNNRANVLHELLRSEEALANYDKVLAVQPDHADAQFNRALTALSMGDFPAGWAGYESRWLRGGAQPSKLVAPYPLWRGEDLHGKRIVVYEEQGLGDIIHFARFLPRLSVMGAEVTFLVRASMHRLLRALVPAVRLVDTPPPDENFDFQCALLSLPGGFGTTLDSVPAEIPYLFADEERVALWRQRLGAHGFKVGVCWQGNPSVRADIGRSTPLRCYRALAAIPGVRLISLQKTHGLDQLASLPGGMAVQTLGEEFDSGFDAFVDTAAVIANLDLVVTCDTAVAHLAGAMGRPVWLVLKYAPDWRWLRDRGDSPWYPTMRLFRQPRPGAWDAVFEQIAAELVVVGDRVADEIGRCLALHREGKLDEAAQRYARILEAHPRHFDALHLLGVVRNQQGHHEEAVEKIGAALALRPTSAEALSNLGLALAKLDRYQEAVTRYDEALALRPDYPEVLFVRGNALSALRRAEEAIASYDRAVALRPDFAEALNNRGNALIELRRPAEALASLDAALALRPDYPGALNNRGNALRDLQRPADALASYEKALALQPDYADALSNRGNALGDLMRSAEALESYDRALALRPDHPDARCNRAFCVLSMGDFAAGWADYEYRWQANNASRPRPIAHYPPWRGEDLRGKRIIVYHEQGFGDVIQFARYLCRLSAMGASVTLLVRSLLHRLLRSLTPTIRLVDRLPDGETFDYQCALLSLPGVLGTTLDTVPADVPYLFAEEALVTRWRQRLGSHGFKIGVCWQGNPTNRADIGRSAPLRCYQPIAAIPGVRLISLQAVNGLDQLTELPAGMTIEGPGAELDRGSDAFVDAAAVIANLDLVVTSDTAMAHLAGALGAPVWIALKYVPDWRWLRDRENSPWYPTARLFRQRQPGDWEEVFARIAAEASPRAAGAEPAAFVAAELDLAFRLHRDNKRDEAAHHYAAALKVQPDHFDALHLLGAIRLDQGRGEEALEFLTAALKQDPSSVEVWTRHGLVLERLGRLEDALASYDKALALQPDSAETLNIRGNALQHLQRGSEALASYDKAIALRPAYAAALYNRGNVLHARGQFEEALADYDRALAIQPDYPKALNNRGNSLHTLKRHEEALESYDKALALQPDYIEALTNKSVALRALQRPDEALENCDRALVLRPDYVEALTNRGGALGELKRYDEALASYNKALAIWPDYAEAYANRAIILNDLGRLQEALASYDKALGLDPGSAQALNNRGIVLRALQRPAEAVSSYDNALAIRPDYAEALNHRGNALHDLGRLAEALASYDQALALRPDYCDARFNRSMTALLLGDFSAGWADYECRWDRDGASPRKIVVSCPAWQGETIRGKRLLVYEEQGLGDVIQFARYLPIVSDLGAVVTFLARPSLHRLLRPLTATIRVDDRVPAGKEFDFQCALMSLPVILGTTLESIPAEVPFLSPEPGLVERWRHRIGSHGFKIGICWQGNPDAKVDIGRSAPLRSYHPIAAAPGVRLISLQKVHGLDQLADLPRGMVVESLDDDLDGGPDAFIDTAAVIANLDLVICSDTAIAHLAGALGAPVWLAVKYVPDWRWLLDREDSPWYPTMRLFRQPLPGDWDAVIARMAAELAPRAAGVDRIDPAELEAAFRLFRNGNLDDAALHCAALLEARPDRFDALHLLGVIRTQQGRHDEALDKLSAALRLQPSNAEAWAHHGLALERLGRLEEALASHDKAVTLSLDSAEALNSRGNTLRRLARHAEALASYDRALAVRPDYAEALNNRGNALHDLDRFEEALASYDRSLALQPEVADVFYNRARSLEGMLRIDEARASYERALALRPDYAEAHFGRAVNLLLSGNYAEGWREYEWRWKDGTTEKLQPQRFNKPLWRGEDLAGKTILLHAEQGLGDTIQFARFASMLAADGNVVLAAPKPLLALLRTLPGPVPLVGSGDKLPAFDCHLPLLSIGAVLGITPEAIPDNPYLLAEPERIEKWRERLSRDGFRIGIAWQGNPKANIDQGRSPPLRCFAALAAMPGVRLVSLQKRDGLDQLQALPEGMQITSLGDDFDDGPDAFLDAAAVIANLDLVVASDTAVAHLAGALGRPVWVALRHLPDWRWMLAREDSPWYPTMRLFRQRRPGDWDEVFARIAGEVAAKTSSATSPIVSPTSIAYDLAGTMHQAVAAYQRGDPVKAERLCRAVIAADAGRFDAHNLLGVLAAGQGKHHEALTNFDRALALRPNAATALTNRGNALHSLGHFEEALASCDQALAGHPDDAAALSTRGNALLALARPAEALASYDRVLAMRPGDVAALSGRGTALFAMKRFDEALASYDKALLQEPNSATCHFNRAQVLLLRGRFAEGWPEFEWRRKMWPLKTVAAPEWRGEDLRGKRLLLRAEEPVGDTIQFARLVSLLADRGAAVVLSAPRRLVALLRSLAGPAQIVVDGETRQVDFQLPLMSVPHLLGLELGQIPAAVPYLSADPVRVAQWAERLPKGALRVGIAWQGNPRRVVDRGRSIPLRAFAPLAAVPGVQLVSLQLRDGLDQLQNLPEGMQVTTFGDDFDKGPDAFLDTAAVIANLDLVVACDSAVAHLAGALARPVWVALKNAPSDWRWMLEREDSPWYPTARLFRQRQPGDWNEVFARMAEELAAVVGGDRERLQPQPADGPATAMTECRHGRMVYLKRDPRIGRSLALYGEFAELESEVWAQLVRRGDTVVEVGADIGAQTMHLARLIGPNGALLAFEADRVRHQLLCANLALNGLSFVEARRGPAEVDDLALSELRMLRIDGGGELDVLRGARRTIARLRPVVYVANDNQVHSAELLALLDAVGYNIWSHLPILYNPTNFSGNSTNVFGATTRVNLLCLPREADNKISGLRRIVRRDAVEAVPLTAALSATAAGVADGYAGFFINLDRSSQRRIEIEAQLARFGLEQRYRRFPAADGNILKLPTPHLQDSEMGCFISHYLLLKDNLDRAAHLHVIEDDAILSELTNRIILNTCLAMDRGPLSSYDIICTETYVGSSEFALYKKLYDSSVIRDNGGKFQFQVIDLQNRNFACLSSYIVNRNSIGKLHDLCEVEINNCPRRAVDVFYRIKCYEGVLRIGCIFPFVTSINLDHITKTTIAGRYDDALSPLAMAIARATFFVGCDWEECQKYLKRFPTTNHAQAENSNDQHAQVLRQISDFIHSDHFRRF